MKSSLLLINRVCIHVCASQPASQELNHALTARHADECYLTLSTLPLFMWLQTTKYILTATACNRIIISCCCCCLQWQEHQKQLLENETLTQGMAINALLGL